MPIHKLTLLDRRTVARDTLEFHFEKPEGFTFKPGQYGGFTLIDPPETDEGGITRRFSLLSTPADPSIVIATRAQKSAYKRVLNELPMGSLVKFAGPTGNFVLHEALDVPAVLIAGGIGITPFFSMIKDAAQQNVSREIYLFYGNNTGEDAAYQNELAQLERDYPQFKFISVLAKPDENWAGEKGYITHELIKKYISDLSAPIYYICGSPVMVSALQETLMEMGIADEKIKVEDFPGY